MRIGDWSSDVCSSDLRRRRPVCGSGRQDCAPAAGAPSVVSSGGWRGLGRPVGGGSLRLGGAGEQLARIEGIAHGLTDEDEEARSEEHTSELQSLMRISYAVFCLKNKKHKTHTPK